MIGFHSEQSREARSSLVAGSSQSSAAHNQENPRLKELIDGKVIDKRMNDISHLVASRFHLRLADWAENMGRGIALCQAPFRCFHENPGQIWVPDVAFISFERLVDYEWGKPVLSVVPDMIAEIVTPFTMVEQLEQRIEEFQHAGTKLILVIYPAREIVRAHRSVGEIAELAGGDVALSYEAVLPGFRLKLDELFAPAMTVELSNGRG